MSGRKSTASVDDKIERASSNASGGRKSEGASPRASVQTASPRASVKEGDASPRGGSPGTALPSGEKEEKPAGQNQGEAPKRVAIVDRGPVSSFFAIAVLVNTFTIGIDTQIQASGSSAGAKAVMLFVEVVFLFIFSLELILRIIADRCPAFLFNSWNLLDAMLVASSGVDIMFKLVLGLDSENGADGVGKLRAVRLLKITRVVRLLRVVRVFRFKKLLRMLRGLVLLVFAIMGALKALGWVALMFIITTYIFSIITVEFLGIPNSSLENKDDLIDEWFGDMPKSMFTLLQLATLEDWARIARHTGKVAGGFWTNFFLIYVMGTNSILMNVVLATLIENLFSLSSDMKDAQTGDGEDIESWMATPSELASDDDEDGEEDDENNAKNQSNNSNLGPNAQQSAVDRLAQQTLSEIFDLAAHYVGQEGVNQRKLVTQKSLRDALARPDVQAKVFQAVPQVKSVEPDELAKKIWGSCPKLLDPGGLSRQELAEACMVLRGELSMNHFVVISQALQSMDTQVSHELVHLNKHQRKMNRRFLKMRHRLRKVYQFDGAPRKMVDMMEDKKRKQMAAMSGQQMSGYPMSPSAGGGGGGGGGGELGGAGANAEPQAGATEANDGSSVIEMSEDSSQDEEW